MTADEVDAFENKFGYKPTLYRVALSPRYLCEQEKPHSRPDLTAARWNILEHAQAGRAITETWGSVGLWGDWANNAITLYGRDNVSGTHEYFREHVLQNGDYKTTVREDSSLYVVEGVANDRSGIGYSGVGWRTSQVRTVPLRREPSHT